VEASDAVGDGRENGQTAKDLHVGGCSSPSRRGRDATRRCVQVDAESHLLLYQAVRWGGQFDLTLSLVGKGEPQARVIRDDARAGELQLVEAPFVVFLRWAQGACWTMRAPLGRMSRMMETYAPQG
jgi:hypothetical protein